MKRRVRIDRDIPIPESRTHGGRRGASGGATGKYPWAEMEVGDSFLVKNVRQQHMGQLASAAGARLGRKFSTRTVENGVRVWRIK